jgi:hypothetical protein
MSRRTILIIVAVVGAVMLAGVGAVGASAWQHFHRDAPIQREIVRAVAGARFDLVRYEVDAIAAKIADLARRPGVRLTADEQRRLVEQYQQRAEEIRHLQSQVNRIYADPAVSDAEAASADLRAHLASLRDLQADIRPEVEAILERQVGAGLANAGLTTAGTVFPPLRFNFISPPNYLVVSPRDRIELEASTYLQPDLDMAEIESIEKSVAERFDRSTLVEGLGGLGAWPTLVLDQASLAWILDTIAHEWVHNYLVFHPLGQHMFDSPGMNTINETVATIVGEEVGQKLAHDLYDIPYPTPAPAPGSQTPLPPPDPEHFDFQTEMHRTRLHVDELLAQGQVDEAENYMEQRRQEFVKNGYALRKLNQAFFAFHGSYATGAASSDPIGPKLQTLRKLMPDLATFMDAVRGIRQPADLDALLAKWQRAE